MLRRFWAKSQDSLSGPEEAAIARLVASHNRLQHEGDRVDTQSQAGFAACIEFLECLDQAAYAICADKASRAYRSTFTNNYRALFPDEERNYRVDVLDASVDQHAEMWVNGEKFEFSSDTIQRGEALQRAWPELGSLFGRWNWSPQQNGFIARPARVEVQNALVALDFAWAGFEQKYIIELIEIEDKARTLIVQAIRHAKRLDALEAPKSGMGRDFLDQDLTKMGWADWHQEQAQLVQCIARLNSVANVHRKGRDDLGVDILLDALAALRRCDAAERRDDGAPRSAAEPTSAARMLANDVVEAFAGMRSYLHEVKNSLEHVDPHLCNNAGLVERLVDWEESWELGARYVRNERLLNVLCALVDEIRTAQRLAPALTKMCEEVDVELFMVLPRIVWLQFLAKPAEHEELVKSLLPHRFNQCERGCEGLPAAYDSELQRRVEHFQSVTQLLTRDQPTEAAWRVLVMRVVNGHCPRGQMSLKPHLESAVEKLVHELEGWSMELQRHCPEDWNQLSAVLVQCLTGEKSEQPPFRV